MTDNRQRREVYYKGTVQGVGFRYTVRRSAARFSLTGYVQNLPDGRVLVVAEGLSAELDRFLNAVTAALGSYIRQTDQTVAPASGEFRHFDIRF